MLKSWVKKTTSLQTESLEHNPILRHATVSTRIRLADGTLRTAYAVATAREGTGSDRGSARGGREWPGGASGCEKTGYVQR